jgi:hypothetical protein
MSDKSYPDAPRKPYWTRGAKTARHTYFYPADDLPGVLLFGLIAVLGAAAVVVAARHILISEAIVRRDGTLLGIGLLAFALGSVQGYRLWRDL